MTTNTIGSVAKNAGVGVETVRFYERKGLIPQPRRPARGFRIYPPDTANRIRFIRHAGDLGFTLAEVRELLSLRVEPRRSCAAVKHKAEGKLETVEHKIDSLRRIRVELRRLTRACDARKATEECPILEALA